MGPRTSSSSSPSPSPSTRESSQVPLFVCLPSRWKKEDIEFEPVATSLPGHLGQQQQQNPTEQQQQRQHNTSEFALSLSLSLSHRETTGVKRYLSIILCSFVTFCVSLICSSSSPFITSDLTSHVIFIYFFLILRFVPQRERQHGIGQSKDFVENPPSVLGTHNTNIMGESACQVAQCFFVNAMLFSSLSLPCFYNLLVSRPQQPR